MTSIYSIDMAACYSSSDLMSISESSEPESMTSFHSSSVWAGVGLQSSKTQIHPNSRVETHNLSRMMVSLGFVATQHDEDIVLYSISRMKPPQTALLATGIVRG